MRAGQIFHLHNVPDEQGRNLKGRYVVVVTRTEDISIENDSGIYVVACTSSLRQDQLAYAVELPFHPDGIAHTGFRKRTWAKPLWFHCVKPSQLGECIGYVRESHLQEIIDRLPPEAAGSSD